MKNTINKAITFLIHSILWGKFVDTKGLIRRREWMKDRQYNGPKGKTQKDKQTENDRHNNTQKTKDWATQSPLSFQIKTDVVSDAPEG